MKVDNKRYKPSYYNLIVPYGEWLLLFNGVTSGLMRLPKHISIDLLPLLGNLRDNKAGIGRSDWKYNEFSLNNIPESIREIFPELLRGRFFIPQEENELDHLKNRYEFYKKNDPFLVTITTTLDCNLGCYYCYEDKSKKYLSLEGCDRIIDWIIKQIKLHGHKKLYTDWYGGEPMLNINAINYFSSEIIKYCDSNNIGYSSSMISNGTEWPKNAKEFVINNRIKHIQFSLDGPREASIL